MISGYLITKIIIRDIDRGTFTFSGFYERRARRILPALIVVIVFSICLGSLLLLPNDFENLGQATFSAATFSANIFYWLKIDYFSPAAESLPLLHLWSLGVEEQFYFVWPIILYVVTRGNFKLVLAAIFITSLAFAEISININKSNDAFYFPHLRAWELVAGCAVCLLYTSPSPRDS